MNMWCLKCTENDDFIKINVKIFAGIKKNCTSAVKFK